jgi:Bardet-Biedl syndrome 2 protein
VVRFRFPLSGWSNGRLEVRNESTGSVGFRDEFDSPISSILKGNYRMEGREEIICCASNGEVRGYLSSVNTRGAAGGTATASSLWNSAEGVEHLDASIAEFQRQKTELVNEIRLLDESLAKKSSGADPAATDGSGGVLPPDMKVQYSLLPNSTKRCVELSVMTGCPYGVDCTADVVHMTSQVVNSCREAIKKNMTAEFLNVIRTGKSAKDPLK